VQAPILVEAVEKRYGERPALRGVTFHVATGEIVGLLGPNGAGKSTMLSILATIFGADRGRVAIAGFGLPQEAASARRAVGFVPQREALYPTLTARENVEFFACMLGLDRARSRAAIDRVLTIAMLDERSHEPISGFSVGMRRRLNLACGLLHDPRVLLLDEPTVGVDPQSRERIFAAVRELAASGTAVLYSTHAMEEAERLCHRIVLLDEGTVVASGTTDELVARARLVPTVRVATRAPLRDGWLADVGGARIVRQLDASAEIEIADLAAAPAVMIAAARAGGEVLELSLHRPDLADVFFALTGRALRDHESRAA
jgi:ABC-2 type transport system ATP-binding protein